MIRRRVQSCALVLCMIAARSGSGAEPPPPVELLIDKSERTLIVFSGSRVARVYSVALGEHPVGPKERRGDGKTPEGRYVIDAKNYVSRFHRALHISYPSPADKARALARGLDPGGNIMIHGIRAGLGWVGSLHRAFDWTDGCIALTDREMDELWKLVPPGTAVEIRP